MRYAMMLAGIMVAVTAFGQDNCAQQVIENELRAADPVLDSQMTSYDDFVIGEGQHINGRAEKIIIPTVFHIIHMNGPENISDAQVHDAVRIMNETYSAQNEELSEIASAFVDRIGNADIEFRLASKGPSGEATTGIDRVESPETFVGDDGSKLNGWPRNKYLNIWVTDQIYISVAAAYAYRPAAAHNMPGEDGIIADHRYVGSIGTGSPGSSSTTLTHEIGHFLNLPHTWGPTNEPGISTNCSVDDGISDTPNTIGVGNSSCNTSQSTCGSLDNVQNYMDYASCESMFTEGQVNTMRTALGSSVAQRDNLGSSGNLDATGVTELTSASFFMEKRTICRGEEVTIYDESRYDPDSWSWEITGPVTYTSTDQNPTITFTTAGDYSVSLTVTQNGVTKSITETNYFSVAEVYGSQVPFEENFALPLQGWHINSYEEDDLFQWGHDATLGFDDNASMKLYNVGQGVGRFDDLVYSSVDFRPVSNIDISFRVAYAMRASGNNDKLEMSVSRDCGESWRSVWSATGATLAGANGIVTSIFAPDDPNDWKQFSVSNVPKQWFGESTFIRFRFTAGGGNQIYLDNINIGGDVSVIPRLVYPDSAAPSMNDDVVLRWTGVPNATSYDYELDTSPNFNSSAKVTGTSTTNTGETSELENGSLYYWRVKSTVGGSASLWSETWPFTVASDGVGIGNLGNDRDILVYPNPSEGLLTIVLPEAGTNARIRLYAMTGQLVFNSNLQLDGGTELLNVDLQDVVKGTYLLMVDSENKTWTQRVSLLR